MNKNTFTWNNFADDKPDPTEDILVLGLPGPVELWPTCIEGKTYWFDREDNEHKLIAYDWWCYLPEGY